MSKTKFTPGPWKTDPKLGDESVFAGRRLVADCAIFAIGKNAPSQKENQANARFIAAAPDLYSALRTIAEFPVTDPKNQDAVNMALIARVALRKATGEPA